MAKKIEFDERKFNIWWEIDLDTTRGYDVENIFERRRFDGGVSEEALR